jgi:hypothetical protein
VQHGPFVDQRIESQRRLGPLALGFRAAPMPLGLRVDPFRHRAEPGSRRIARLLDRDVSPNPERLTHLPPGRGVGPLSNETARPPGGHPNAQAGARRIED